VSSPVGAAILALIPDEPRKQDGEKDGHAPTNLVVVGSFGIGGLGYGRHTVAPPCKVREIKLITSIAFDHAEPRMLHLSDDRALRRG
jgi:hypothetical protein